MGTISTANAGYLESDFDTAPFEANLRALRREIKKAKEAAAGRGMVAVNAMVATRQYPDAVKTAIDAGANAIVSGAGLPLELPALAVGNRVALAPIVSGPRAARLICRTWDKRYSQTPDFVVLEGCQAGGHLGFDYNALAAGSCQSLEELLPLVLAELKPYEEKYRRPIPVFVGGGVATGREMARFTRMGAAGAQIATRFIATYECDASQGFKDVLLRAKAEDVCLIHSPVGLPGRAIKTPLVEKLVRGQRVPPRRCIGCLKNCTPEKTPFCITHALAEAAKGNYEEGLFFSGSRVELVKEMLTVPQLMEEIMTEWRLYA